MALGIQGLQAQQVEVRAQQRAQLFDAEPLARLAGLGGTDVGAPLVDPGIDAAEREQPARVGMRKAH